MIKVLFLISILTVVGCSTSSRQTDALYKKPGPLPLKSRVGHVPMIKQDNNLCGPSSMAMVLAHQGRPVSLKKLKDLMFTKKMKGTFQSEMTSLVRRQGMLGLPV